jgi:putative transcriptional regulator
VDNFSSLTGRLLLSPPWMDDPNFARSVVMVLAHTPDGAFGIVINDESSSGSSTISDVVGPAWAALIAAPESIFVGGPCETTSVIALGLVKHADGRDEITVVDLNQETPDPSIQLVRLFAGYAGWGPEQLDGELATGGWFVAEAELRDGLSSSPDALWDRVMQRNGNPYARLPHDPRLN